MAARFTKLSHAIDAGIETMTAKAAVEQIEYWEDQLKDVDVAGAKGILTDLHSLKGKLQAETVDGAQVGKLLASLGEKTGKIADRVEDEKVAEQLKLVGEGLSKPA